MSSFELIIFDCDGVLVDSERLTAKVFANVIFEECGLSYSLNELTSNFMGKSSKQCLEIIENKLGHKPPNGLEHRYKTDINNALSKSVEKISGIDIVLQQISIPYCVASGGSLEKIHLTLNKTHLFRYFDGKIFSASDVSRPKPFPDIFHHAATSMGCHDPSRCLVIEDSPHGVEGGVAAGMIVFGFADLITSEKLVQSGAHHIITDMSKLANEIESYDSDIRV